MPGSVHGETGADNDVRRLRVDIQLGRESLRRVVTEYLATEPLLPRWRLELAPFRAGRAGTDGCSTDVHIDVRIVDQPAASGWRRGLLARTESGPVAGGMVILVDDVAYVDFPGMLLTRLPQSVVLADGPVEEVADGIDAVVRGGCWVSPSAVARLTERVTAPTGEGQPGAGGDLTETEQAVLRLVVSGLSNKEVATRMHVATSTVRTHVRSILRKAGCENRHQLTAQVMATGRAGAAPTQIQP